jgi:aminoglycoside phosphotransferase (APT) family kinase protein
VSELAAALARALDGAAIEELQRLSGGASRETWGFTADGRALVLRRDPPGRPGEAGGMAREAAALRTAHAAGLAVPELVFADPDGSVLGTPGLVMERVAGETIARRILREQSFAAARAALTGQLAAFAAGLHALPVPSGFPAPEPIAELRGMYAQFGWPSPTFDFAFAWLASAAPSHRPPALVHGDLRLGNVVVDPTGLRAVLDWELAHAGDPASDLGWLCVRAWRFGSALPAAGVGTYDELLAGYRAAGGGHVSVEELRWWEVWGTLRWGLICMRQARGHLSGGVRSVELAAIGRRACETEWDLLLLLAPAAAAAARSVAARSGAPPAASPYGRPTAAELLDAVRDYLTDEALPATSGPTSFHARVAANALAVVARELAADPPPVITDPADPDQLARNVAAKLAVANPKYFG